MRSEDSSQEARRSLGALGFPGASSAFCTSGEIPLTCVSCQRGSAAGGLEGFQKRVWVKSQQLGLCESNGVNGFYQEVRKANLSIPAFLCAMPAAFGPNWFGHSPGYCICRSRLEVLQSSVTCCRVHSQTWETFAWSQLLHGGIDCSVADWNSCVLLDHDFMAFFPVCFSIAPHRKEENKLPIAGHLWWNNFCWRLPFLPLCMWRCCKVFIISLKP